MVELQPGHRQPLGAWAPGCSGFLVWFLCHVRTHDMWTTVQQVVHDQIFELGSISFVQMTHSYWPLVMSSWMRVAKSAALDLEPLRTCLAMPFGEESSAIIRASWEDWPGTKSWALTLKEPDGFCSSASRCGPEVSWPPKVLWEPNVGLCPALVPPRLGFAFPRLLEPRPECGWVCVDDAVPAAAGAASDD